MNTIKEEQDPLPSSAELDDMVETIRRFETRLGILCRATPRTAGEARCGAFPLEEAREHIVKLRDQVIVLEWKRLRGKR